MDQDFNRLYSFANSPVEKVDTQGRETIVPHVETTFAMQEVEIGGEAYTRCNFRDCKLVYSGGTIPKFKGCNFQNCTVILIPEKEQIRRQVIEAVELGIAG